MGDGKRLDCKCASCGYVWTLAYLPLDCSLISKFSKAHCPKCHSPKPLLAGKDDLTTEDRLTALLRRAHDAMSRREPDGISTDDWDQLVADMAKEFGMSLAEVQADARREGGE